MSERPPPDSWLGDLRWQGYPRLEPVADLSGRVDPGDPAVRPRPGAPATARLEDVVRQNEELRAKLDRLNVLAVDFERRLEEAGRRYEDALLEAETRENGLKLERERLSGELDGARAECARREAREKALENELENERRRREEADRERDLARRRLEEALTDLLPARRALAEQAGALAELRRQAGAQAEKLLQAKALTDDDVRLLRQEMREFLAKFHRLQDALGEGGSSP